MSTTILLLFSLLNVVCYLFIIICAYKHHIVLLLFFPMYSFLFSFSVFLLCSQRCCVSTPLMAALLPWESQWRLWTAQEKQSHHLHSSVLSCYDMQGPNAACWLFYSSCFAAWILSTVVTITLLSLGFSRDTVADVEGCDV